MAKNPYVPDLATIVNIKDQTGHIRSFTIEFDDDKFKDWSFKPGQFVEVSAFGLGEVPLSISSSPTVKGHFGVTVRNSGKVTAAIHKMKIGDKVGVRGPYGNSWPFEKMRGNNVAIIAGGIGLAGVSNVLRYIIANRIDYKGVQLLYGANVPNALIFIDEYNEWKQAGVDMHITVDRREGDWSGNVGLVTSLFNDQPATGSEKVRISPDASVMVCGPPIMIDFCCRDLVKAGFAPENIYLSLEGHMKCGIGKCGHCNIGSKYVCKDGPVFTYAEKKTFEQYQ